MFAGLLGRLWDHRGAIAQDRDLSSSLSDLEWLSLWRGGVLDAPTLNSALKTDGFALWSYSPSCSPSQHGNRDPQSSAWDEIFSLMAQAVGTSFLVPSPPIKRSLSIGSDPTRLQIDQQQGTLQEGLDCSLCRQGESGVCGGSGDWDGGIIS